MSLLTGPEIARLVAAGEIKIEPYDPVNLNPNSYNLTFSNKLMLYRKMVKMHNRFERWGWPNGMHQGPPVEPLDMAIQEEVIEMEIPKTGMFLWPGLMYLGATAEYTETPKHAPKIDGRSSVGRLGKMIHVTAGFGDVGFRGDWTLEIVVMFPLKVYPGVPICQIAYSTVEGEHQKYVGQYQGQRGPKPSGLWRTVRKHLGLK